MEWREFIQLMTGDAARWEWPLSEACERWDIRGDRRVNMFLAQCAHESGGFRYLRELWGPTAAQARYEGRLDLGNTEPGDGKRYLGRGLIQITGRTNYAVCGLALGLNLLMFPELLEDTSHAAQSAGWYWHSHGLNEIADEGDFERITRRINGGMSHYDDGPGSRMAWLRKAEEAMA